MFTLFDENNTKVYYEKTEGDGYLFKSKERTLPSGDKEQLELLFVNGFLEWKTIEIPMGEPRIVFTDMETLVRTPNEKKTWKSLTDKEIKGISGEHCIVINYSSNYCQNSAPNAATIISKRNYEVNPIDVNRPFKDTTASLGFPPIPDSTKIAKQYPILIPTPNAELAKSDETSHLKNGKYIPNIDGKLTENPNNSDFLSPHTFSTNLTILKTSPSKKVRDAAADWFQKNYDNISEPQKAELIIHMHNAGQIPPISDKVYHNSLSALFVDNYKYMKKEATSGEAFTALNTVEREVLRLSVGTLVDTVKIRQPESSYEKKHANKVKDLVAFVSSKNPGTIIDVQLNSNKFNPWSWATRFEKLSHEFYHLKHNTSDSDAIKRRAKTENDLKKELKKEFSGEALYDLRYEGNYLPKETRDELRVKPLSFWAQKDINLWDKSYISKEFSSQMFGDQSLEYLESLIPQE